ncbi:MAG TPA: hypothetical protein ENJ28_00785 [Gammaproteobacteria bacterium]|nr:hypothetical protein [Gammaproteobacteria bacterium]
MEELAKAIQKKYVDDLTAKYPLHNFLILFLFILSSYIYNDLPSERILPALSSINISFLFDFKKGLLSAVSLSQFGIAILQTIAVTMIYSWLSKFFFRILSKSSDFDKYTKNIENNINASKSSDEIVNYYVSKDISIILNKQRTTLKGFHIKAEILLTFLVILITGINDLIFIDWLFLIASIFLIVFIQWRLFLFYISNFIPYYVSEKCLLNGEYSFGDK